MDNDCYSEITIHYPEDVKIEENNEAEGDGNEEDGVDGAVDKTPSLRIAVQPTRKRKRTVCVERKLNLKGKGVVKQSEDCIMDYKVYNDKSLKIEHLN